MSGECLLPKEPSSLAAAEERRLLHAQYDIPEDSTIVPEYDHTQPAELADQLVRVENDFAVGSLLVSSTHQLDRIDKGIEHVYMITHGVMRNARQYRDWLVEALGCGYDPRTMAVVAPQFAAPCDLNENSNHILRWGFHDWRAGEEALAPSPPISAYDAKDELARHLADIFPNLRGLHIRNNSEGAQQDDRWLAFSRALKLFEADGMRVEGITSNPGSVLYFHPLRPTLINPDDRPDSWEFDWHATPADSLANRWPFGIYQSSNALNNLAYGPPPYIRDYLKNYSMDIAIEDYVRRTTAVVGAKDNDSSGMHLPMEVGPREQGSTRLRRVLGKSACLASYSLGYRERDGNSILHVVVYDGLDHDGASILRSIEVSGMCDAMRVGDPMDSWVDPQALLRAA